MRDEVSAVFETETSPIFFIILIFAKSASYLFAISFWIVFSFITILGIVRAQENHPASTHMSLILNVLCTAFCETGNKPVLNNEKFESLFQSNLTPLIFLANDNWKVNLITQLVASQTLLMEKTLNTMHAFAYFKASRILSSIAV